VVEESVSHGDEFDTGVSRKSLRRRAGSSSSTSNQPDPNQIISGGSRPTRMKRAGFHCTSNGSHNRTLHKLSAREPILLYLDLAIHE
jgi:hypothetical protein